MKKIIVQLVLIAIFISVNTVQNHPIDNILPNPIFQYKLPNDLNVVSVPFNSPGIAAFIIVVRTGSRNEVEEGVTGFAHFFEHMMFRGTDYYSKEQYDEVLKSIGATSNAYTKIMTRIFISIQNF